MGDDAFLIARNPEEDSKLPYLLRLPIGGGLVLKARDTWPRAYRIYCHPFDEGLPAGYRFVTPRFRWSSQTHGSSPKSGSTAS